MIALPVTCPQCGVRSLSEFPVPVVLIALTRWNNMALYADCHDARWSASAAEIEDIRAFLGARWLEAQLKAAQGAQDNR